MTLYAILMYPLAYLYIRGVMFPAEYPGWGMPLFAVLFLLYVELAARAAHRTAAKETPLWAGCWLALSVALSLFGYQPEPLGSWQWPVWHLFAVWYVLARCGMLAQGHSGSLALLDAVTGCFRLPFGNFFLRAQTVFTALRGSLHNRAGARKILKVLATAAVTLLLCGTAWGLLAAADANFAALGQRVASWWKNLLDNVEFADTAVNILLSLPVGAWLFGLVFGALRRTTPPVTADACRKTLEEKRFVPRVTAVVAVAALCCVYTLFFALQAGAWFAATPFRLSAPDAAAFAVDGFWELLKILLLNFSVLAAVHFLGRAPLPKPLAALFCAFGVAFSALAAGKLAVYVTLYALTPRRVVAGWSLFVLAACAVLALVRVFRAIPAAKLAVFIAALSFTVLSCMNIKRRIIDVNVTRYEVGTDATLDMGVLWECGYENE